MAGIDLSTTMDALAAALVTGGIVPRAYGYPVDNGAVPYAMVGYPTAFTFSATFQRGSDEATIPVYLILGAFNDKSTRDRVSDAIKDTADVVSVLEAVANVGAVRVSTADFEGLDISGVRYVAIRFDCEVIQ